MEFIAEHVLLEELPLFGDLSRRERKIIESRANLVEHKKGEIIYSENSPADAFYCLITGRVVVYTQALTGGKKILEYLHRGKYFGMISLLTDEPHSVTAEALNDCRLLVIKKDDFDYILKKIPRLAIDLSRTLSRRLKRKDVHQKMIFESTIISVFSSRSQSGKSSFALNLSLSLAKETRKRIVLLNIVAQGQPHTLARKLEIQEHQAFDLCKFSYQAPSAIRDFVSASSFGVDLICLNYKPQDESCASNILAVLSILVNDYHYLILDLPSLMDHFIFSILNQSDLITLLTSPEPTDLQKTNNLIERLKKECAYPEEKVKIIINEYKLAKLSHHQQVSSLGHDIFATLPKREVQCKERAVLEEEGCEYAKAIRRVARHIGDSLVGLVLGVGVGYGFCHIGVLKVIEEEKIPIDVIAGSSVGAIIASLWVSGHSADEILKITREFKGAKNIWSLIDLTIPILGFIKGRKLYRFLKRHFGNKTFDDVRLPLKVIASDVKRKEPRVLDKGYLADAIMASCSMPGVFTPFKFSEEMLFDGGVTNPLPTEPLLKMGIKKIIAVNVTPSREDIARQYEKIKEGIAPVSLKNKFKTNILDIIFSSIEILQSEVAQKEAQLADVVLHPDTNGLYWLEFHRAEEFAKRGEEEVRRNLDKIRQLIGE